MRDVFEKPRIILFGSNGFIGSHLFSSLVQQGYFVMRAEFDLAKFESYHLGSKLEKRKTIVISMAWSSNSRTGYLKNPENLIWAKKHIEIAKSCLRHDYIFVTPGTCLEYGENQDIEYVQSKIQLRKFVEENLPTDKYIWLRYFYVFSLAHRRPGLIRDALEAKSVSKPFITNNLNGHHDYIEVRDAVAQTIELISELHTGVWDIGSGRTRSNLEVLSSIRNIDILESGEVGGSNEPRISWEGSAEKLIPNYTHFTKHTDRFFGTLWS